MKFCPNCGAQVEEGTGFCPACGQPLGAAVPAPIVDPYDHTAEFDPQDISDNKVYAMLMYLTSAIGIIIALLASKDSPYLRFHVRECVKLTVVELLVAVLTSFLFWTIIVGIAGFVCMAILFVVQIICFVRICKGQAREVPIVCKLGFLK